MRCTLKLIVALLAVALAATVASGTTFQGSLGNLEAEVTFTQSGSDLVVELDNISMQDVLVPADVLQAVLFDLDGVGPLQRVSAMIADGSTYVYDNDRKRPDDGNVGGEWAYIGDLDGAPAGAKHGISATGMDDIFGPKDRFPGRNLEGPKSPDGMQYGILSKGDDITTGNAQVTGREPFIKHAVVFTLAGLPAEFDIANDISNVWFQYGTSIGEPGYPGILVKGGPGPNVIPEPTSAIGLAMAVAAAGGYLRRRRKTNR